MVSRGQPATIPSPPASFRLSFQPFVVQCQTCGSRLRVTEPGIVGTIAACPKCNSMVQIERPLGVTDAPQVAVGQSDIDSQAITEEGIAVGQDEQFPAEPAADPNRFAGSESIESAAPPSLDQPQWQSERTRRSKQIALVVALSLSGLLIAGVVFGWFVRSWRAQALVAQTEVESTEPDAPPDTADSTAQRVTEDASPDISAETDAAAELEPAESATAESATTESESTESALSETVDPAPGSTADGNIATEDSAVATEPSQVIPSDLVPTSPIIPDPVAENPRDDDEAGSMEQLPPELEKYTQFLLDQGVAEAPTLKAPPTMDEVKIDEAADEAHDPLLPARPKELNLKADLSFRVALDSRGYPLADLMLLISQTVGVPIQLDWVSFDLAGIDIDQTVAVKKGWWPAGELLEATASSMGAEIREQKSLIVLTLSDDRFEESLATITSLEDFGDDRESASKVLKDFLRDDEAVAGELQFGQSREGKQLAALAVESLRRMRGMEAVVEDNRLLRWAHASEHEFAGWRTLEGGDAGEQLDAPVTLAGFLRRISQRNGATCVVNWYDGNRRGAAPAYLVFPHVRVDAATTLEKTLEPFSLQARRVDSKHWWVGSEATYDRLPVVVWTPKLGEARETFTQRMNSIMAGASRDAYRLTVDEHSGGALMLLPRYIVRQLPKIAPAIAAR